jgi:hypothetical protein
MAGMVGRDVAMPAADLIIANPAPTNRSLNGGRRGVDSGQKRVEMRTVGKCHGIIFLAEQMLKYIRYTAFRRPENIGFIGFPKTDFNKVFPYGSMKVGDRAQRISAWENLANRLN